MTTIPDLLAEAARRGLGRGIATSDGSHLSYPDLQRACQAFATTLRSLGLDDFDRVAVFAGKSVPALIALFGAASARMVAVPINPALRERQLAHILNDARPRVIVVDEPRAAMLAAISDQIDGIEHVLALEALPGEVAAASPPMLRQPLESDPAILFYSSGSTGWPKGIIASHRNVTAGAESMARLHRLNDSEVSLVLLPLNFDAGLNQVTSTMVAGGTCLLQDFLFPHAIPDLCERHGVTSIVGVPPIWLRLLQANWSDVARRRLRRFANTGGHLPKDAVGALRALFPEALPFLMYGFTEAFRATCLPPEKAATHPTSVGVAIPFAEIAVLDPDGMPCPPHTPGELVQFGPLVTLGYWNAPEATGSRFRMLQRNGHACRGVFSGDTVVMDDDGLIYFVARRDDMIKTSGYRVSPSEIEDVAYSSGLIADSAAAAVPDALLGQAIALAVVPADRGGLDVAALQQFLRTALPSYMQPRRLLVLDTMPLLPNGKIDRRQVQRLCEEMPVDG